MDHAIERFLKLLAYETWANERSLASLGTVATEHRSKAAYVRATQLLPHCALARMVWLFRLREASYENPADWFPSWSAEETLSQHRALDVQWREFLGSLGEGGLARTIRYASSEGVRYESAVEDVVTHAFNHSTYHRGQLARLVHECGGQRATTDFIFFSRRTL
jgi:uncharacterized damage-inducible protein DinB